MTQNPTQLSQISEAKGFAEIVAITVSYNRPQTLKKTIHAISNQIQKPRIVLVDNGATHSVKATIEAMQQIVQIDIVRTGSNLGGAGGFTFGMKYARENYDPDWYWIMDDDAYPEPNTLSILFEATQKLCKTTKLGFVAPLIVSVNSKRPQIYHHKTLSRFLTKDLPINLPNTETTNSEQIQLEANAFVGPLISKNAIELIGYPDEKLFIYGDDTDYTYRISRVLPSYLCPKAIIYHEDPPKVKEGDWGPKSWWKNYYYLRNRFIFVQTHASCRKNKYFGMSILLFKSLRTLTAAIFSPKYKKYRLKRVTFILCAISDGLRGKKGKRIDPANL